jgi:hypothetical protein
MNKFYRRWENNMPCSKCGSKNTYQIPRLFLPDFYIPQLGLFIEICGSKKFDYKYRQKIYEKTESPLCFCITTNNV